MAQQLDLLRIAQEEQKGDLFKLLDSIYKRSAVRPTGYPDAIIWEGGNAVGGVKPVAHAFTDMFALKVAGSHYSYYNVTGNPFDEHDANTNTRVDGNLVEDYDALALFGELLPGPAGVVRPV